MKKSCLTVLIGVVFIFLVNYRNKNEGIVVKFPESFYNKQHRNCIQVKSKFKVVNYISVNCSVCFNVIKEWHTLFKKNEVLLIGNPFDNKAVMDKYIKMGVIQ